MDTLEEKRKRSGYDGTEGTPLEEVQKLCDVHAALFRAAAPEAEEAADPSLLRKQRAEKTRELTETAGHPLSAFHREKFAEFGDVMNRAEDMIYKEENILFPNCASYFTKEEWMGIYHDAKDYPGCFGVEPEKWEEAEKQDRKKTEEAADGRIKMQGGEMTVKQLSALLNARQVHHHKHSACKWKADGFWGTF